MSEPDTSELDWQLAMAHGSCRRRHAEWDWRVLLVAGALVLWALWWAR